MPRQPLSEAGFARIAAFKTHLLARKKIVVVSAAGIPVNAGSELPIPHADFQRRQAGI